ncbi:hypothetical protein CKO25_17355 [Thiocapsa imhoffii]|uniref:Uncharacterized protein n=1 Tax=Thiocapsa imhoffii TaxID=382777 RepID=A0A9X0WKH5_9GAMM|nr:hypothetical protein [Thiocapsa imhoffii]MBK1646379.1 hypothetical protein [Thiocapsa imhoffii]
MPVEALIDGVQALPQLGRGQARELRLIVEHLREVGHQPVVVDGVALKALSGRLALRLAEEGTTTPQMIALAMVQRQCARADSGDEVWLPLSDGILIPVDDVPELFQRGGATGCRNMPLRR